MAKTVRSSLLARPLKLHPPAPTPPLLHQVDKPYHHLLRSCDTRIRLLKLHARVTVLGLASDELTRVHLLNAYSFHGALPEARTVFGPLGSPKSVMIWNSMVRAFAAHGCHDSALELHREMLAHGVEPDKYTFTFVLKACAGALDSEGGVWVHREVVRRGLEADVYIRTALVHMYCKLYMLDTACQLFEAMPEPDAVTWNAMIAGFSQVGKPLEALRFFKRMQSFGLDPNSVTLLNLFPSVCRLARSLLCRALHGFAIRRCLIVGVSNGLIDTYCKCGNVEVARQVFDGMGSTRDDVSWATMISGYAQSGCFVEALELFDDLRRVGAWLNVVSVVGAVSAATELEDLHRGMDIHAYATQKGLDTVLPVVTALITMYATCDYMGKARELFHGVLDRDIVLWSAMVSACAQTGYPREALSIFREMQEAGCKLTPITATSVLPVCAELLNLKLGKSVHSYFLKSNVELDGSFATSLLAMYSKCGCFGSARALFDMLPNKDVAMWNALINGYAQFGDAANALKMFSQLRSSTLIPDFGTMAGVITACVLLKFLAIARSAHGLVLKASFDSDLHVKNAIIDMYAKCGDIEAATVLFHLYGCSDNVVSWNIMIAGFMVNAHAEEAISAFHELNVLGLKPNLISFVSILPAAAYLSDLKEGTVLHSYIIKTGFEFYVTIGNSLIDMYSKCGRLDCAKKVFNWMDYKDTVTWNAMIIGYAINGLTENALDLFSEMKKKGVKVDKVSYVAVLSACRHGGLVEEGRSIFQSMTSDHLVERKVEHYACMVDLLGRSGKLPEAWDLIQQMPMKPDASVWGAFLDACRTHSNVEMAKIALEYLIRLESQNAAPFVSLSNTYAQLGSWIEARSIRQTMSSSGVIKEPGRSWL